MRAGRLNKRVTIQAKSKTTDSYGQEVVSWVTAATVWAGVEPLRGREYHEAQQVNASTEVRIVIRHRSDVDTTNRIVFGAHTFEIQAIIDPMMRGESLELMCRELR